MSPEDIQQWSTVAQSSGLTAGGFLALMTFLLWKGLLWTKPQVDREQARADAILAEEKKSSAEALEREQESAKKVRETELAAKDVIIANITAERDRETVDKVYYRTAEGLQRDRADALQGKVSEEIVPLLRVTNKIIAALPGVEDGET